MNKRKFDRGDRRYRFLDEIPFNADKFDALIAFLKVRNLIEENRSYLDEVEKLEKIYERYIYKVSHSVKHVVSDYVRGEVAGKLKEYGETRALNYIRSPRPVLLDDLLQNINSEKAKKEIIDNFRFDTEITVTRDKMVQVGDSHEVMIGFDLSLPIDVLMREAEAIFSVLKKDEEVFKVNGKDIRVSSQVALDWEQSPSEFSKSIRQRFGDFLFVYDCKMIGCTNEQIRYLHYDYHSAHGGRETALDRKTINRYFEKAIELLSHITP